MNKPTDLPSEVKPTVSNSGLNLNSHEFKPSFLSNLKATNSQYHFSLEAKEFVPDDKVMSAAAATNTAFAGLSNVTADDDRVKGLVTMVRIFDWSNAHLYRWTRYFN